MEIRDRIRELRRVKAAELLPNPKNWRRHPKAQADALRGILAEVGYADALLARELPDGKLILVDGHLRAETTPSSMVPVLVLDVTEEEADKILLTLDPLAAMAEADADRVKALLGSVQSDNEAVKAMLERLGREAGIPSGGPLQEPPAQIDKAAELKAKWGTETGQLWQIGPSRLLWSRGLPGKGRRGAAVAGRRPEIADGVDRPALRRRLCREKRVPEPQRPGQPHPEVDRKRSALCGRMPDAFLDGADRGAGVGHARSGLLCNGALWPVAGARPDQRLLYVGILAERQRVQHVVMRHAATAYQEVTVLVLDEGLYQVLFDSIER